MSTRRRVLPLAALVVTGLAISACSGGESGDAGEGSIETLTIMAPYFSETPPDTDDPVQAALSEIAGVDLDIQWVPNASYPEKFNTTLAAGSDIPHLMFTGNREPAFVTSALAGGFWDLTEHLTSGEYPNLVSESPDVQAASSINGALYGVYRARPVIRQSVIIRQDWLDNLGLEAPETTDELMAIAQAFTEDDPDGNGEDDTYGIIMNTYPGPYQSIETWFGSGNVWRDDDGELIPAFLTEEWREALDYQREMVENGYINADFATMDPSLWNEPFLNGEGGIIIDVQGRAGQLRGLFEEAGEDPDEKVTLLGQLDGPNGTYAFTNSGYGGIIAIPKSSVQTEEQLKQVLQILNDFASPEAQILQNNGIEGDNFSVEDGYAVYNPDRQALTDQVSGAWAQLTTAVAGKEYYTEKPQTPSDEAFEQLQLELYDEDLANAYFNPGGGLVSDTYTKTGTQLDIIINDARIQYLAGQIDEAGLDAAIQRWRDTGGDQMTTEMNELYSDLG